MKKPFRVILYYKYHKIQDPALFVQEQKEFCEKNNLLGRVLIAEEGINGTCAGTPEAIESYMNWMHSLNGFKDLWFKIHDVDYVPFKRLEIRARKEIVALKADTLDAEDCGKHIEPEEANKLWEQGKKDGSVVFFDVRNEIEAKIGKFKNAITPNIEFFRELPAVIDKYADLKDKKVVLYCTGGIRCEKASALFKKKGFKDVSQINGGIYHYCQQFPDKYFEGTCFVFDDRMQIGFEEDGFVEQEQEVPDQKIISSCDFCGTKSKRVVNDERNNGHHLVVCCEECDLKLDISRIRYKKKGEV